MSVKGERISDAKWTSIDVAEVPESTSAGSVGKAFGISHAASLGHRVPSSILRPASSDKADSPRVLTALDPRSFDHSACVH
jgi:hypothetical protein